MKWWHTIPSFSFVSTCEERWEGISPTWQMQRFRFREFCWLPEILGTIRLTSSNQIFWHSTCAFYFIIFKNRINAISWIVSHAYFKIEILIQILFSKDYVNSATLLIMHIIIQFLPTTSSWGSVREQGYDFVL